MSLSTIWLILLNIAIALCSYFIPLFKANSDVQKQWQEKMSELKNAEKRIEDQRDKLVKQEITSLNEISEKKSVALQEYQRAIQSLKLAEQIRMDTKSTIEALQKQNRELHSQLNSARQRAERFAKRAKLKTENEFID